MAAKTKTCPGCGSKLAAELENCPNCPYSWPDESRVPKSRHGGQSAGPLMLVAIYFLCGFGIWKALSFVTDSRTGDAMMGETRAKGPPPAPSPELPVPVALPPPVEEEDITIAPERADVREWRLRGVVYDLVTLKPVGKAAVTLQDPDTDRRLETMTDSRGRYRVTVPSLKRHGYNVILRHPDYAPSYLNPGAEGVAQKSEHERAELASELARSLSEPYTVHPYGSQPLVTDFFLAPRSTGR